ncbi:MAG: hypothetical protein AAF657_17675 [Acidobacteriota bacterium]
MAGITAPIRQHLQFPSGECDHRHAVFATDRFQLPDQAPQSRVSIALQGKGLIDEDQETGAHPPLVGHAGNVLGVASIATLDRLPVTHFGKELDLDLATVHQQAKVPGFEAVDPLALAIGHHRLEVDHPHVDHLAEDRRLVLRW